MKLGYTMAAAVLAGALIVGCDKKQDDMTAPAAPSSTATPSANPSMQNASDAMKKMGDNAKQTASDTGAAMTAEAQKMSDKMHATTMPTAPAMPMAPSHP